MLVHLPTPLIRFQRHRRDHAPWTVPALVGSGGDLSDGVPDQQKCLFRQLVGSELAQPRNGRSAANSHAPLTVTAKSFASLSRALQQARRRHGTSSKTGSSAMMTRWRLLILAACFAPIPFANRTSGLAALSVGRWNEDVTVGGCTQLPSFPVCQPPYAIPTSVAVINERDNGNPVRVGATAGLMLGENLRLTADAACVRALSQQAV